MQALHQRSLGSACEILMTEQEGFAGLATSATQLKTGVDTIIYTLPGHAKLLVVLPLLTSLLHSHFKLSRYGHGLKRADIRTARVAIGYPSENGFGRRSNDAENLA